MQFEFWPVNVYCLLFIVYCLNYFCSHQKPVFMHGAKSWTAKHGGNLVQVPVGREINRKDFELWFARQIKKGLAAHKVFEEFKGVLSGPDIDSPWLSREQYLTLGIRQSLFDLDSRDKVYDLFEKYLAFMGQHNFYDSNIVSQQYLGKVSPKYDFVVIDEVQDISNTQLMLILKALHHSNQFLLCGDANLIVHPNFFSCSTVMSLFLMKKT